MSTQLLCPRTGKISYPSRASARRAATSLERRVHGRSTSTFDIYSCPFCPGWHFGHRRQFSRRFAS